MRFPPWAGSFIDCTAAAWLDAASLTKGVKVTAMSLPPLGLTVMEVAVFPECGRAAYWILMGAAKQMLSGAAPRRTAAPNRRAEPPRRAGRRSPAARRPHVVLRHDPAD